MAVRDGHTKKAQDQSATEQGFTLIELSIVLVIIGLIVGGVLVGQDLIKAAQIRATITQIEKLNTAANTFRLKYNGLPGDVQNAANLGLTTRTGAAGHGDGNGLIEGCAAGAQVLGCETALFFVDLSGSGYLEGSFTTATDAAVASLGSSGAFAPYLPAAKLGSSNYISIYTNNNYNWWQISVPTATAAGGGITAGPGLTVAQAYGIDKKLDDGNATTGYIIDSYITGGATPAVTQSSSSTTVSATTCDNGGTPAAYATTAASALNCAISLKVQF